MNAEENMITDRQEGSDLTLCRHPDETKVLQGRPESVNQNQQHDEHPHIEWTEETTGEGYDENDGLEKGHPYSSSEGVCERR